MRDLLARAAQAGASVHLAYLDGDTQGLYDPELKRIYLDIRNAYTERRSSLAHELGHHHYGHTCDSPAAERQARAYAARLLIDPVEYERLERISDERHYLADEFSVTVDIIDDFRLMCLTSMRGVTYTRARHGLGQWAHRALRPVLAD